MQLETQRKEQMTWKSPPTLATTACRSGTHQRIQMVFTTRRSSMGGLLLTAMARHYRQPNTASYRFLTVSNHSIYRESWLTSRSSSTKRRRSCPPRTECGCRSQPNQQDRVPRASQSLWRTKSSRYVTYGAETTIPTAHTVSWNLDSTRRKSWQGSSGLTSSWPDFARQRLWPTRERKAKGGQPKSWLTSTMSSPTESSTRVHNRGAIRKDGAFKN